VKTTPELNSSWIDDQALRIVRSLQQKDHTTYLVGGCVRDLLLGLHPKDFDIATSALPKEVNRIVRPSHVIGKRFRLVLARRHGMLFEIATFRAQTQQDDDDDGPIRDDNTFGSPEEDAKRRDFTINGLFYDPVKSELIDYTEGLRDIEARMVRMIGDPEVRIQEDPIRMLRALRFSHRTGFSIEPGLRRSIFELADKLEQSVLPRKREEFLKLLRVPQPVAALWEASDLNVLKSVSPTIDRILNTPDDGDVFMKTLALGLKHVTDPENPYEIYAVFLYSLFSTNTPNLAERLKVKQSLQDEFQPMLKSELGIFRAEQDYFFSALNLIQQLRQLRNPLTMKAKFRDHLARNNALPVALTLCTAYQLLPGPDLYFWLDQYWLAQNTPDKKSSR